MDRIVRKVIYIAGAGLELAHKLEDGTLFIPGGEVIEVCDADWHRLMTSGLFEDRSVVPQSVLDVIEPKVEDKAPIAEKKKGDN